MNIANALDAGIQKILYYLTIALFIALTCILTANVALRLVDGLSLFFAGHGFNTVAAAIKVLFPTASLHWFDEIVELCFAALVFYGAAALWAKQGHFSVGDWISARLPGNVPRALYRLAVSCVSLAFVGIFFFFSMRLTLRATELSTVFQIPKSWMYACMPISSFIMCLYSLRACVRDIQKVLESRGPS
jgi:TRAP-type C4-dicarboxylate transport system permease small subunit